MARHLAMPIATACGAIVWPNPNSPSTTARTEHPDVAIRHDHAVLLELHVTRHADHAVAVVADKVGGDEVTSDALGLGARAPHRHEDVADEVA